MASLNQSDIQQLKSRVKGTVIVKGEASAQDYKAAISRWNEVFINEAAVIVYVEDEADIAECIRFVTSHKLDVAVCAGGHALKGTSSSDDFVIDLRKMQAVSVDTTSKTVTAQGGCKMHVIENAAYDKGLAIVTGVCSDTGMGIALGAGLGWLSGQYGFMVDNILSAKVALADASVVTASEDENPDLFWAIRGTGGGFGVITEITFKAYEQGPVFAGFLIYSPDKIDEVIDLADELMTSIVPSTGGKLQVFLSFGSPPPAHTPAPVFVLFYNGPEGEARDICARLYALGPVADTTSVIPYPVMNTLLTSKMDTYKRHGLSAARLALPLDKDILKMAWESYASTIPRYKDTQPSHIGIELRDLRAGLRRSAADMAFAGRGNWTNILIHSQWDDPSMDYELRKWAKDLSKKVEDSTRPNEEEKEAAVYANYASGDEKSKDIFGGNLERLRELKAKYDPGMLFHKWYPIEPKKEYVDGA